MGIYGHKFDILIEISKEPLTDKQKEQQKLYYDAKKLSDDHNFTEARKIINAMNDIKGENNYRIWAVAYMKRRQAEMTLDSKDEDYNKEVKRVQKEAVNKIKSSNIIDSVSKGVKGIIKVAYGVIIIIHPELATAFDSIKEGLEDIVESVSEAKKHMDGIYQTKDGCEIVFK